MEKREPSFTVGGKGMQTGASLWKTAWGGPSKKCVHEAFCHKDPEHLFTDKVNDRINNVELESGSAPPPAPAAPCKTGLRQARNSQHLQSQQHRGASNPGVRRATYEWVSKLGSPTGRPGASGFASL